MNGSAKLTDEQREWYRGRFGVAYTAIPDQPWTAPRKQRRKLRFKPKAER